MNKICEILAGSRLYGLETPDSDFDTRGVFLNTDSDKILGLSNFDIFKQESKDILFFELRHFLKSLKKTNTQSIELLFADDSAFSLIDNRFSAIRQNRLKLIDSKILFKSLLGYIQNEKRLANGERTGKLGGKRRLHLEKYGFSPKNFCHLLRLAYCGKIFFSNSFYPVDLTSYNKEFRDFLFSIKTNPEGYSKENLNSLANRAILDLQESFENRKSDFSFDSKLANSLCLEFYLPYLISEFHGGSYAKQTMVTRRS